MIYRIEYKNKRVCDLVSGRDNLLKRIRGVKDDQIVDIRKVFKSGVSDSVYNTYKKYVEKEAI